MREELKRLLPRPVLISRARQRLYERPGVAHDRELSLIEERLHLGHVRVKAELPTLTRRVDREQTSLREREPRGRADGVVLVEARLVERHYHVVAVVAAVEENADERAVVALALRVRVHEPEALDRGGERSAA